jgi:hypothetical protein
MKYFLKAKNKDVFKEVSISEYIEAETIAGFNKDPRFGIRTIQFSSNGVIGKTEEIKKIAV